VHPPSPSSSTPSPLPQAVAASPNHRYYRRHHSCTTSLKNHSHATRLTLKQQQETINNPTSCCEWKKPTNSPSHPASPNHCHAPKPHPYPKATQQQATTVIPQPPMHHHRFPPPTTASRHCCCKPPPLTQTAATPHATTANPHW
jgi:hypothetical protein